MPDLLEALFFVLKLLLFFIDSRYFNTIYFDYGFPSPNSSHTFLTFPSTQTHTLSLSHWDTNRHLQQHNNNNNNINQLDKLKTNKPEQNKTSKQTEK